MVRYSPTDTELELIALQMDPNNDVLLAYRMNDRPLHPDHGYVRLHAERWRGLTAAQPLRSIIPGFVGGRCVKWLRKVWISDRPSTNWYHIYDNRVLPSHVTDNDSLDAKGALLRLQLTIAPLKNRTAFFHHPDTICNEQALQSVICKPAHNEAIRLDADASVWRSTYRVAGYAYSGGGVQIQRVRSLRSHIAVAIVIARHRLNSRLMAARPGAMPSDSTSTTI